MENSKVTLGFVAAISLVAGAGGAWLARGHGASTAPTAQVATGTSDVAGTGVEQSEAVVADGPAGGSTPARAAALTTAPPAPPRTPERQLPARPSRPAAIPSRSRCPIDQRRRPRVNRRQ